MMGVSLIAVRCIRNHWAVQLVVQGILRFGEFFHGLSHAACELRELFRTEKKENDDKDNEHIGAGKVSEESEQGRDGHRFVAFPLVALGWACRNGRFLVGWCFSS